MEERGEKQRQVSNKKEQIFLQQYHQKMEQEIIQPIDKELLKQELTPERQLRMTNKSNNEIYVVTAHEAPNVMKEIGRLREIAFREAGGGTGKSMDIDEFDTMQLLVAVWHGVRHHAKQLQAAHRVESGG